MPSGRAALRRVGLAAIAARYPTDAAVEADPVGAMVVCMDAMRATLGLRKPEPIEPLRPCACTVCLSDMTHLVPCLVSNRIEPARRSLPRAG